MIRKIFLFFIVAMVIYVPCFAGIHEKKIVLVVPSYNNSEWYQRNLDSIFGQKYRNYHVFYIDDCTSDATAELVERYIVDRRLESSCSLIKNSRRVGALMNIYRVVHQCEDDDIIVLLDGDDWLKDDAVLSKINHAYTLEHVWLTYGQFELYPSQEKGWCADFPKNVVANNSYRSYHWVASHLRTFYAGLFKRIRLSDLMYNNQLFPVAWDLAMMFPMLEMAHGKIKCFKDPLYVYNVQTPLNDFKLRHEEQLRCEALIRAKEKYDSLSSITQPSYNKQEPVDIIVFAHRDAVADMYEQFDGGCNVHIIPVDMVASVAQAFKDTLDLVSTSYVFVLQDTAIWSKKHSLIEYRNILAQTQAHSFSLVAEPSSNVSVVMPSGVAISQGIIASYFSKNKDSWSLMYKFEAEIYAVAKLKKALKDIEAHNLPSLLKEIHSREKCAEKSIGLWLELE